MLILRSAAACLELLHKRGVRCCLEPVLQRGHDLPDIAAAEGWDIEPEPRKDCRLVQPVRVRGPNANPSSALEAERDGLSASALLADARALTPPACDSASDSL